MKPDTRTAEALEQSLCIIGGLDNDIAGIKGGKWWEENYKQYKRWPVPGVKDPGDLARQGGDNLRLWVATGMPPGLLLNCAKPIVPEAKAGRAKLVELHNLLKESGGYVRIYDQGYGLGHELPIEWKHKNPGKVHRITQLFYSPEVSHVIENLADGLYNAARFPL